jgi:hypothetical protein
MDDDLDRRIALLKQAMAEPLTVPTERNADLWFRYLMERLEEYRRKRDTNE